MSKGTRQAMRTPNVRVQLAIGSRRCWADCRGMAHLARAHLAMGLVLLAACATAEPSASPGDQPGSPDGAIAVFDATPHGPPDATAVSDASASSDASTDEPPAPPPPWGGFTPTGPGYQTTINPARERGVWEGWGASLAWWAQGVGGSVHQTTYADLFFTLAPVTVRDQSLPGLGLTLVRYNVGGGGRPGDIPDLLENVPSSLPWYKDIDGFEIDWQNHDDPASPSWDFTRDPRQRSVLDAALARGVTHVELFANAPMWWMTVEKSSAGGSLQSWNGQDFSRYLATVAAHARAHWGVTSMTVEPFNEPTAGWWNYPHGQEGCNIDVGAQTEILGALREALDARGLADVRISASDENSMTDASRTLDQLAARTVLVNGGEVAATTIVDQLNVHGYSGLEPFRDNAARTALREKNGNRRLWMSEYGDPDGSGMALAQTISEDLTYLQPSAWLYWQPAEPYSGWGLVNGAYADSAEQADRGKPTWVYTKYFVFAQFTRFLRPGAVFLDNDDHNSVAALQVATGRLALVTVNFGNAQVIRYDLRRFASHAGVARVTYTRTDGSHVFERFDAPIVDHMVQIPAEANSVYSLVVDGVTR
jgi:galactan endo-1,6-beta-galactosidase